jgi:hypothetical protein
MLFEKIGNFFARTVIKTLTLFRNFEQDVKMFQYVI